MIVARTETQATQIVSAQANKPHNLLPADDRLGFFRAGDNRRAEPEIEPALKGDEEEEESAERLKGDVKTEARQ